MSQQVSVEVIEAPPVSVEVIEEGGVLVVEVIHPGPQGPSGGGDALPPGGNPGDILMKDGYSDSDAGWAPTLDGGTFF